MFILLKYLIWRASSDKHSSTKALADIAFFFSSSPLLVVKVYFKPHLGTLICSICANIIILMVKVYKFARTPARAQTRNAAVPVAKVSKFTCIATFVQTSFTHGVGEINRRCPDRLSATRVPWLGLTRLNPPAGALRVPWDSFVWTGAT